MSFSIIHKSMIERAVLVLVVVIGGAMMVECSITSANGSATSGEYPTEEDTLLRELKDVLSKQQEERLEMDTLLKQMMEEIHEIDRLTRMQNDLERRTLALQQMIRGYNSQQVSFMSEQLEQDVMNILNQHKEKQLHAEIDASSINSSENSNLDDNHLEGDVSTEEHNDASSDNEVFVTLDELQGSLTWDSIDGYDSENRLKLFANSFLTNEFEKISRLPLEEEKKDSSSLSVDDLTEISDSLLDRKKEPKCVDHQDAANRVYHNFLEKFELEKSMKQNNVLVNATIIHSMTSSSYTAKTWEWLKPFMPQDWERWFLTDGWEKSVMPTYSPSLFMSFSSKQHGSAKIANPPETVTSLNNNAGSCWAIPGQSGQITFRLHTPLTSINKLIVSHTPHQTDNLESAPRYISLIGYPPCDDNTQQKHDCKRLGFDTSQPTELKQVEFLALEDDDYIYEKEENDKSVFQSTQVFDFIGKDLSKSEEDDNFFSEGNEIEIPSLSSPASCNVNPETFEPISDCDGDEEKASRKADDSQKPADQMPIKALSFVVNDNWGHPDYTCIYSLVVQGQ